jgi:hypothetical protein
MEARHKIAAIKTMATRRHTGKSRVLAPDCKDFVFM